MPRIGLFAVLVLGTALFSAMFSAIRPVWMIDPDASLYVSLGRSLAQGEGYTLDGVPHAKYPPGWPLLLAGLMRWQGTEAYGLFHGALVATLLVAAWLAGSVTHRLGYPPPVAWAIGVAVALSQTLFDLSVVYLRTEVPFTALCLASLLAFWRCTEAGRTRAAAAWWTALCGASILAAMSVRLAGVALLALPTLALVRRRPPRGVRARAALLLALGIAALGAWQWRASTTAGLAGATDYGAEFRAAEPRDLTKIVRVDMPPLDARSLARRVAGNAEVMTRAVAVLLTNVDSAGSKLPVGALLLLLVLAGAHRMWWRPHPASSRRRDAAAFAGALVALTLIWPFNQQERFYVPLLPLLLLMAGEGAVWGWSVLRAAVSRPAGRFAATAGWLLVLAVLASQRSDRPDVLGRYSAAYAGMLLAVLGAGIVMVAWLRRGVLPEPAAWLALVLPLLVGAPFAQRRFVEWPAQRESFDERRAAAPRLGPLARIDVDSRLEAVAVWLGEETPEDTVLMTDVPRMLQVMSGRRCVPFVYSVDPPGVLRGDADFVFYTHEIPEATAVMEAVAGDYVPALELEPVWDGQRLVVPTVYRPR